MMILKINIFRRPGGQPWQPTKNSRICSAHFVGGKKSDHPHHPAFHPTLLPSLYKPKNVEMQQQSQRFNRRIKRALAILPVPTTTPHEDSDMKNFTTALKSCQNVSVQTDPDNSTPDNSVNVGIIFCNTEANNACTYANIPVNKLNHPQSVLKDKPALKNARCGPDTVQNSGFEGYKSIDNEEQLRGLSGVTNHVYNFLLGKLSKKSSYKISKENRLLLFLVKMKLGLAFAALGVLFNVHRTTASRHFFEVLQELVDNCQNVLYWPSRFAVQDQMPKVFANYPKTRAIIDCTEIFCEKPPTVEKQIFMYSDYKGRHTVKYLIAITPSGFISFISRGYGGRATDAFITQDSGILNLLQPADTVMADKGFPLIKSHLDNNFVELVMPPFAKKDRPFSANEVDETYQIASVRIHVERCISRLKLFHVLEKVTVELLPYVDSIVRMCGILVNMQPPIIKADDD